MRFSNPFYTALATLGIAAILAAPAARASVNVFVQPQGQVVGATSNATFAASVTATAGEVITGYTWLMSPNNQNPFATVATGQSFTITNAQGSDMGYYFVRVAYLAGTNAGLAVSTSVLLTVQDRARVTGQPEGMTRITGSNAAFNVTAAGSLPLIYQWRLNGTGLVDDARISGSTSSNLSIIDLITNDAGQYDLVVTNVWGADTSSVVTLVVQAPPSIDVAPVDTTLIRGSNAVFTVIAAGTPPFGYRWQKNGSNLNNGGRTSGVTTGTLTIANTATNDEGDFTVVITNSVGAVTSAPVHLTILVPPVITTAANAAGQQGTPFIYTSTATGTLPITFGADGLPDGLSIEPTNGVISGTPTGFGEFDITLYATNVASTATSHLALTIITSVPGITSGLALTVVQGHVLNYVIQASNNPVYFNAAGLPLGVHIDTVTGIISGPPVVSGTFPVTITAGNQFGEDVEVLNLNIPSAIPVITSPLVATGTENLPGFQYAIQATNEPAQFGATGLPTGFLLNPATGVITGTPTYGGTNNVTIWARNAWGTGSNTLQLQIRYATLGGLQISNVVATYSTPYLLDFSFSLVDDTSSNVVVRPPTLLSVVCLEDGVPIANETAFIVDRGDRKQLKTYFALDYSYSMFIMPGAIDNMESSVTNLINQESVSAQFGVYEFSADYVPPKQVTGFSTDKAGLSGKISGIRSNFVNSQIGGTRCWDAVYTALGQFGPTNTDEQRFLIIMTDGNDDSSVLNTNGAPVQLLVQLAQANSVRLYCVAFGTNVNTAVLEQLTGRTMGRYFQAATAADLPLQFDLLLKDIRAQYLLRWATVKRAPFAFQPMFTVTVDGLTATFNTEFNILTNTDYTTNFTVDTNTMMTNIDITTNITTTNLTLAPLFNPPDWGTNVNSGGLRLVADAVTNATSVTLRATYVPRFVREFHVHYAPNWPCTAMLNSAGPGEIFNGWSLTETNDGFGGRWLTVLSPNPTDPLTSLPYAILGDLVTFQFQFNQLPDEKQAFSLFIIDNTIYSNLPPSGQSFVLSNAPSFITVYAPTPPHGTPVPWMISFGITNNFAAAELADPNHNGLPTWQDYQAGLNPTNVNSYFIIRPASPAPFPNQHLITFSTALNRTYRVESTLDLVTWTSLLDGIAGTGGDITVSDNRDLSGVPNVFYRVIVH